MSAVVVSEETLDHFERGARIAFGLLDRKPSPHTDDEREWYGAELKRRPAENCNVFVVKYDGTGRLVHSHHARYHVTREKAEWFQAAKLATWAEEGRVMFETDGSRWAVEIRDVPGV